MDQTCAHEPCTCPVSAEGEFCGPGCQLAAKEAAQAEEGQAPSSCGCLHADCEWTSGRDLEDAGSGTLA